MSYERRQRHGNRRYQTLEYNDGRTKQAFKEQCDINAVLNRAAVGTTRSHLENFGGQYGDFTDFDFAETQELIARGLDVFQRLPRELKKEFNNNAGDFYEFVNDPNNVANLAELLPELAAPGRQMPEPTRGAGARIGNTNEPRSQQKTPETQPTNPPEVEAPVSGD